MSGALKQRVYSHIYQKLFNGELRPGDRLSGRALAKEIGVSLIPARDAINQLRNEGLIESRRGGGNFVPEPSYEDLMDIYDQREALECHAVARVAASIDTAELEKLESYVREMASVIESLGVQDDPANRDSTLVERWVALDAAFHDTLMHMAGNQRSLKAIVNLRVMTRIFGKHVRHKPHGALRRVQGEHARILAAIRAGDADKARSAMAEHIRNGCRSILDAYHRKRVRVNEDRFDDRNDRVAQR